MGVMRQGWWWTLLYLMVGLAPALAQIERPRRPPPAPVPYPGEQTPPTPLPDPAPRPEPRPAPRPGMPYQPRRVASTHPGHRPIDVSRPRVRWPRPYDYRRELESRDIFAYWVMRRTGSADGFRNLGQAPFFAHNGFLHRYNPAETCRYEMVEASTRLVRRYYELQSCKRGYDLCALERDALNRFQGREMFFCAERLAALPSTTPPHPDYRRAYDDAARGRLGACEVFRLRQDPMGCSYQVRVHGAPYPDGAACSTAGAASRFRCAIGDQRDNAGCLVQHAINRGYCR